MNTPPTTGIHWLDVSLLWVLIIGVLGTGFVTVRKGIKWARQVSRFFDAILGEPSEFGQPSRPGILERMDGFNGRLDHQDSMLKQLVPNGGGSLRDQTNRIEADLAKLGGRIEQVGRDLGDHMQKADSILLAGEQTKADMWSAIKVIANSTPGEDTHEPA